MLTIVEVMRDGYNLSCWQTGGEHFEVEPPARGLHKILPLVLIH